MGNRTAFGSKWVGSALALTLGSTLLVAAPGQAAPNGNDPSAGFRNAAPAGGIGIGDLLTYGKLAYKYTTQLLDCEKNHVSHELTGVNYLVELGKCTAQEPFERKINELRETVDREFANLNQRMDQLESMLRKVQRNDTNKYVRPVFDGTEKGFEHLDSLAACMKAARDGGGATCKVYGLEGRNAREVVPDRAVLDDIQRKIVTQQFNSSPENQIRGKGYGDLMREFVGTGREADGSALAYSYLLLKRQSDNKLKAKDAAKRSGRAALATGSLVSSVNRRTREITLTLSRYFALQQVGLLLRAGGVKPITNVKTYETDPGSLRALAQTAREVHDSGARAGGGDEVLSAAEGARRFGFWADAAGSSLIDTPDAFIVARDEKGRRRDEARIFANRGRAANDGVMSAWAVGRERIAATGNGWWEIQKVADSLNDYAPYSKLNQAFPDAFPKFWYASARASWQENLWFKASRHYRSPPARGACGWLVPSAAWRLDPGVAPLASDRSTQDITIGVEILDRKPDRPGFRDTWASKTFSAPATFRHENPQLDPDQKEWNRVVSAAKPVWEILRPNSQNGKCRTDFSFGPGLFVKNAESPASNANAPQRLGLKPEAIRDLRVTSVAKLPWLMSDAAKKLD